MHSEINGFTDVRRLVEDENADSWSADVWHTHLIHNSSNAILFDAIMGILTPGQQRVVKAYASNGIRVLRHYWKTYGRPSIGNRLNNTQKLQALKLVNVHENPTAKIQEMEDLQRSVMHPHVPGDAVLIAQVNSLLHHNAKYRRVFEHIRTTAAMLSWPEVKQMIIDAWVESDNLYKQKKAAPRGEKVFAATSKRNKFCKVCKKHVRDHTTANCPSKQRSPAPARSKQSRQDWIRTQKCNKCGKLGHFARNCRSGRKNAKPTSKAQPETGSAGPLEVSDEE